MIVIALIVLAVISAGLGWKVWQSSAAGLLSQRRARQVLVTLKSGEAFSGVLFAVDGDVIVLREATAVAYGPRSENVPVDGEALIQRNDIAYLQLP